MIYRRGVESNVRLHLRVRTRQAGRSPASSGTCNPSPSKASHRSKVSASPQLEAAEDGSLIPIAAMEPSSPSPSTSSSSPSARPPTPASLPPQTPSSSNAAASSSTAPPARPPTPGYFAGGDCTNGGREVVDAVADGKRAGLAIVAHLTTKAGAPHLASEM